MSFCHYFFHFEKFCHFGILNSNDLSFSKFCHFNDFSFQNFDVLIICHLKLCRFIYLSFQNCHFVILIICHINDLFFKLFHFKKILISIILSFCHFVVSHISNLLPSLIFGARLGEHTYSVVPSLTLKS